VSLSNLTNRKMFSLRQQSRTKTPDAASASVASNVAMALPHTNLPQQFWFGALVNGMSLHGQMLTVGYGIVICILAECSWWAGASSGTRYKILHCYSFNNKPEKLFCHMVRESCSIARKCSTTLSYKCDVILHIPGFLPGAAAPVPEDPQKHVRP